MNKYDDDWGFSQVWTKSLEEDEQREYEPRDYLWASELGKPYIDVYLRMLGTKQSNPRMVGHYESLKRATCGSGL